MGEKTILYIEDEENDALLLQLAFQRANVHNPLRVVEDGEMAIAYLSGQGEFADRSKFPLPAMVLLDLNIPRISGLKVLQWIREQPQFASLPVVIYTSSEQPNDLKTAEALGADGYIVKPPLIDKMAENVRQLQQRWLQPA